MVVGVPSQVTGVSSAVQIAAGEVFGAAVRNIAQLAHLPNAADAGDQTCSDAGGDYCHPLPTPVNVHP